MSVSEAGKKVKSILISQPQPENDKNPYAELAKKHSLKIDFRSFIHVEGVPGKELRKEKINLADFSAVIFNSRTAIDHFFRICEELRHEMSADTKYCCNTESTALYLQKYIQYRKRKIFFGKPGGATLPDLIKKHSGETFIFPCSDVSRDDLTSRMRKMGYKVTDSVMYRTICSDLSDLADVNYDVIAFFSPSGIKSLFQNFPDFSQNDTRIAAFGPSTHQAVRDAGLRLDIAAPRPKAPSMTMALEEYVLSVNK
ncbi:MAG TPA: uroporphyrinogen-III synthase [Anseongella sp.]